MRSLFLGFLLPDVFVFATLGGRFFFLSPPFLDLVAFHSNSPQTIYPTRPHSPRLDPARSKKTLFKPNNPQKPTKAIFFFFFFFFFLSPFHFNTLCACSLFSVRLKRPATRFFPAVKRRCFPLPFSWFFFSRRSGYPFLPPEATSTLVFWAGHPSGAPLYLRPTPYFPLMLPFAPRIPTPPFLFEPISVLLPPKRVSQVFGLFSSSVSKGPFFAFLRYFEKPLSIQSGLSAADTFFTAKFSSG